MYRLVDCVATDGQKEGLATARSWRGYAADLTLRLAHEGRASRRSVPVTFGHA